MKKTGFGFLFTSLLCISAYATPSVSDYAKYGIEMTTKRGQKVIATIEKQLTEFNQTEGTYKLKQIQTVNGQAQESEEWVEGSSLPNDDLLNNLVDKCEENGGAVENFEYKGTMLASCKYPLDNDEVIGHVWVSRVAFGMVKMDVDLKASKNHMTAVLQDFSFGAN